MTVINVGFDFDEPIFKWYDLAHKASIKAGIATPEHVPTVWAPHTIYGCSLEEWIEMHDNEVENGDMYHQPFDRAAMRAVKKLYQAGYNVHIITARGSLGKLGDRIVEITKSEILRQGLPYTTLTFAKDKVPVAQALDLHYMIDDAPHNFDPLLAAGINTYLLDERWNQDHEETWTYATPRSRKPTEGRRLRTVTEYANLIMDAHGDLTHLTPRQRAHLSPAHHYAL